MSDEEMTRAGQTDSAESSIISDLSGLTEAIGGLEPAVPDHDPLLGRDIGGVTIVRSIGEGGMGRVYEGQQEKPSRTVAVKVMRPGLTSPSLLKRFEYEAEVLGRLQHPGIAHIYSVGVHRLGNASVPYFVMEYIADARSLTQYAAELKLPTRQRLDLFRSVCDAVAHGHQKGVIHRDLKPSNILVDATGQPKVIDFGVARATDSDMALTTMQTDVGQLIGTLQYMSPEQFDADPNDIDIRSDVYALGVILYELLTEKPPYDVKKKAVYEVMRIVKEDDPTPLSSFNKSLRRDVAVIAGKCLEKDRSRRYSSASELGSDIGRYLKGDPISASPPGFVDGLVRLARKHRTASIVSAGMLALLITSIVAISLFALRAERERLVADQERKRANANEAAAHNQANLAEVQRQAALQAEERASTEAKNAKQRLYVANLYRIAGLTSENTVAFARRVLDETIDLIPSARSSLEIVCLRARLDDSLLLLRRHPTLVHTVVFSPDGSRIAAATRNSTARISDATTGSEVIVLKGHSAEITDIAFSPDGVWCATASRDKTARIWDVISGRQLVTLIGHEGEITKLAFTSDGTRLATASIDKTVRVWDCNTGATVANCKGHGDRVVAVAFMPDDTRLATASFDKTARIWDAATGNEIASMSGHFGTLRAIAISPNGAWLAAVASTNEHGSNDESTRVWDAATGKSVAVINRTHPQGTRAVVFTADGEHIVTAGGDNMTKVWRVHDGARVAILKGHSQPVVAISLSRDGTRLATASQDSTARVWDTASWDEILVLRGHEGGVASLAFNHDHTRLATGSLDHTVRVWNADEGAENTVLKGHVGWVFAIAFSPDGKRLATGSWDKKVRIWDAVNATEIAVLSGHEAPVNDLDFAPDGASLATASDDGTVRIWDTSTGSGRTVLKSPGSRFHSVAFSPDGNRVATVANEHVARVWEVGSWKELLVLRGHSQPLSEVVFSTDGKHIATASMDKTARLWDAADGAERMVFVGHQGELNDVIFSTDGRRVATSSLDLTVRIWDVDTGNETAMLEHREQRPVGVVFTPDGKRVITGAWDNKARIWDADSGSELAVLTGHARQISSIAMNPQGTEIATGAGDLTARLWGVTNAEIYAARRNSSNVRHKLAKTLERWFAGGTEEALRSLQAVKVDMNAEELREAANAVLSWTSSKQE